MAKEIANGGMVAQKTLEKKIGNINSFNSGQLHEVKFTKKKKKLETK